MTDDNRHDATRARLPGFYGQLSPDLTQLTRFPSRFLDVEPRALTAPARRAFEDLGGRAAALGWSPCAPVRLDTRGEIDSLVTVCVADAPGGTDVLLVLDWMRPIGSAGVLSVNWHSAVKGEQGAPDAVWVTSFYGPTPLWRQPDPDDNASETWFHDCRVPLDDLAQQLMLHRQRLAGRGELRALPQTVADATAWLGASWDAINQDHLGEHFNRYVPEHLAAHLPVPWHVGDGLNDRLFDAVTRDDVADARAALCDGADVDAMSGKLTVLELALREASAEMVLLLLDAGASLDPVPFERREGFSSGVAQQCHRVIAQWRAMSPCPPELAFLLERSPFERSDQGGHELTLEAFDRLEHEDQLARTAFDGDQPENHGPRPSDAPTVEQAGGGHSQAEQDREMLAAFSLELDVEADGFCSPLAWACWRGDRELALTFIERGARHPTDIPEWLQADHPLSLAAHHRDPVLFDRLLEIGLRVDDDPLIMRAIAWRGDHATVQRALGCVGGAEAAAEALTIFLDAGIVEPALRLLEAGAALDEGDGTVLQSVARLERHSADAIAAFASAGWRRRLEQAWG